MCAGSPISISPREDLYILKWGVAGHPTDRGKDLAVGGDGIDHPFGSLPVRLLQAHDQVRRDAPVGQGLILSGSARVGVILAVEPRGVGVDRRRRGAISHRVSKAIAVRRQYPHVLSGKRGVVSA